MSTDASWLTLSTGNSDDLILCADFTGTGRPEAGFPDLVARLDLDTTFWHVIPPVIAPDAGIGGAAYVRSWLKPVEASGLRVRAVMGYCVGAVYAAELAKALNEFQDAAAQLIVFDPEQTRLETIRYQFGNVFKMLSSILDEGDIDEAQAAMEQLLGIQGITVERYASDLYRTFRKVGERAFERAGIEPEYGEDMWGTFSSFLSYLSYADQIDPSEGWLRATALSSSSPQNGLNPLGEADRPVATELRFAEGHDELLRSDGVVRAVAGLLAR